MSFVDNIRRLSYPPPNAKTILSSDPLDRSQRSLTGRVSVFIRSGSSFCPLPILTEPIPVSWKDLGPEVDQQVQILADLFQKHGGLVEVVRYAEIHSQALLLRDYFLRPSGSEKDPQGDPGLRTPAAVPLLPAIGLLEQARQVLK